MNKVNIEVLDTEKINRNTENIDICETKEIVRLMNEEDKMVALAVEREIDNITKAIDLVVEALRLDGRIIYIGAGNSGRLAFGDACECVPTFGVEKGKVTCVLAGGTNALVNASEGAEDNSEQGILDLKEISLNENDVLIGLSASGRTPYVKSALEYGKNVVKCRTISISCTKGSEIGEKTEVKIEAVTGAEAINGSTRLKAGTAQKMILNMISTGSMIKIGKVYKNYMVDLSIKNEKLEQRGIKIIKETTGIEEDKAKEILKICNGKVKTAIVMILTNKGFEECTKMLEKSPYVRDYL
ncbi:MAG: N-acetylmuramic acid 6-phosphate etherase [Clostridium sp.]|uniref:N-acetylmuramic acid 6-phosphate etherase n=1 Tax=Clostridium sp. TaxID=1506 RepID=UPI003F34C023